ncbi:hypothetical protein [Terriglobus saanensis]|uniref:Uncharacterized protein n=1 Tax=Terriglobus saanensis (strain ATCC BAA-1853 / DSM 23119 / SP1PR4) TaxID=401053 RepID=E8UYY1_TERSS|nr:hypothetical protein [Terriglobus saanensis]ADV80926.1 hypothetical protein AciPR4_0085 [Terriglobus saanensis SP1PR4]
MRLLIDNLDGQGVLDYSACLSPAGPLTVRRRLNAISECTATLCLVPLGMAVPARRARVFVTTDAGNALFTGYLVSEPVPDFDEVATRSDASAFRLEALSDEWLLDQQPVTQNGAVLSSTVGDVARTLALRSGSNMIDTSGATLATAVGVFHPQVGETVSANLGAAAAGGYGSYRVLNGALSLAQAGTNTVDFTQSNGTPALRDLQFAQARTLVNDITVAGEMEGTAYITEVFSGDGTTQAFQLAERPFALSDAVIVSDTFSSASFDTTVWKGTDPGSFLSLTGAGLTMRGGNGFDGQTVLALIDSIEMAGTLVVEADGVLLNAGSDGVLCAFYSGQTVRADCIAGVSIRQTSGQTVAIALINGVESGTAMPIAAGHAYTFRVRVHCNETLRVLQTYSARVAGTVTQFGGGLVDGGLSIVIEARDQGLASSTAASILFDGTIPASPAVCRFAVVDAVQMFGSVAAVSVERTGSAWVVSRHADGSEATRLLGAVGEGLDGSLSSGGLLTFYPGRIPAAGEQVLVKYRRAARAIARLQDAASVAAEASTGLPGVAQWVGQVKSPVARGSADCENAAAAMLATSSDRVAAMQGKCSADEVQAVADVWPGDLLKVYSAQGTCEVMVRAVTLTDGNAAPEWIGYTMEFANDWAKNVSMTTSNALPADTEVPRLPSLGAASVLANLPDLKLVSASATVLQIDSGLAPPEGGGVEVRRRDAGFGVSTGDDLVLRSPVRSFQIPRLAAREQFFIRMYDGSTPPLYSRFSSAIYADVPVG